MKDENRRREPPSPGKGRNRPIRRRSFLAQTAVGSLVLTSGCLSVLDGSQYDHVILTPPEQYEMLRSSRDEGYLSHPIHGDPLPDVTSPCTLRNEPVSSTQFVGERHTIFTFIFARCHQACPVLISNLRHVQAASVDRGYADAVALLAVTFDPEHDTGDVLFGLGEDLGVEYDVGNWYFLRPESETRAEEIVSDAFGCYFERNPDFADGEPHGDHQKSGTDSMEMAFTHESMIVLANADGYVERTYTGSRIPSASELVDDVQTVVDGW